MYDTLKLKNLPQCPVRTPKPVYRHPRASCTKLKFCSVCTCRRNTIRKSDEHHLKDKFSIDENEGNEEKVKR